MVGGRRGSRGGRIANKKWFRHVKDTGGKTFEIGNGGQKNSSMEV